MKLPQTAEYALRAMTQLALEPPAQWMRVQDLAKKTAIPVHFLSKVMRKLVARRLLRSRRGARGGFRLVRREVRFVEILEAVGYRFEADHCVFGWKRCGSRKPCPLHDSWGRVKESFRTWAEETTLAEVRCRSEQKSLTVQP